MPHPRYASEALAIQIAGASSRIAGAGLAPIIPLHPQGMGEVFPHALRAPLSISGSAYSSLLLSTTDLAIVSLGPRVHSLDLQPGFAAISVPMVQPLDLQPGIRE